MWLSRGGRALRRATAGPGASKAAGNVDGVRAYYTRVVRAYDPLARSPVVVRRVRRRAVERLDLDPGDTVVDVGCGTGANAPFLREAVGPSGTVVGVDVTPAALDRARARRDREGWENVHYVGGDGARLPIAGPVDAVLSTFAVGMFPDPAAAVNAWCDLVAGGGSDRGVGDGDEVDAVDDSSVRGTVVVAYVAPSQRWYGPALTPALEATVRLLTPPSTRLRYEPPLVDRLRAVRSATRATLADRAHGADGVRFSEMVAGLCHVDAATV